MRHAKTTLVVLAVLVAALSGVVVAAGTAGASNELPDGFNGTIIQDWDDLNDIRNNTGEDYLLVNDLDKDTHGYDKHVANQSGGWNPMSLDGTFDGGGHTISDLLIDRPGAFRVGLFDRNDGTIERLKLLNANVTGGITTGALAGYNGGFVSDVKVNANVTGEAETGGVVGRHVETIKYVRMSGSVSANGGTYDGNTEVGGLVGHAAEAIEDRVYVKNSFSTASVSGTNVNNIGGAIGVNNDLTSTLEGVYWDTEASGVNSSQGGTGLTTSEMTGFGTITNMFDLFSDEGKWKEPGTGEYPTLYAFEPATFEMDVVGLSTNTPVEGESITVDVPITNIGGDKATKEVTASVGVTGGNISKIGEVSKNVTLGPDESVTETFTIETEAGDAGDYTVSLATPDQGLSDAVTVKDAPLFFIDSNSVLTNGPVSEGNELSVDVTVLNDGGVSGTKTVSVDAGALGNTSKDITLQSGEIVTQTFNIGTELGDAGDYTVTVDTSDKTQTQNVSVEKVGRLAIDKITVPDETGNGANVDVTVNLSENNGAQISGERDVDISIGSQSVSTTVSGLAANGSTQVTQTVPTSNLELGTYDVSVTAGAASDTVTGFEVVEGELIIKSVDLPQEPVVIPSTESVTVDVVVENTGGSEQEFVNLQTDPSVAFGQKEPTFAADSETTVSMTLDVPDVFPRDYQYIVTIGQTGNPKDKVTKNVRYTDADEQVSQKTVTVGDKEDVVVDAVVEEPGEFVVRYEAVNDTADASGSKTFEIESIDGESELKTFKLPVEGLNETADVNASLASEDASTVPETYYDSKETEPPAAGGGGIGVDLDGIPPIAIGLVVIGLIVFLLARDE